MVYQVTGSCARWLTHKRARHTLSSLLAKNMTNRLVAMRVNNQSSKILAMSGVLDGMTARLAQKAAFKTILELAEIAQGGARVNPFGDRNIANLIDSEAYLID